MATIHIQIQPERVPRLDVVRIAALCEQLAADETLVQRYEMLTGEDNGPYMDFLFDTERLETLWSAIRATLYASPELGVETCLTSIATCTGEYGWDDYLLLHHYDPSIELDALHQGR